MSDSGSFSSLMALVESHLSKTSLQSNQNGDGQAGPSFSLPNICSVQGSASEMLLPPPNVVMQLPRFEVKNSDINEVLAQQVKNMLMAKENRINEEREKQRLADEMSNMKLNAEENDDYIIDLTASIIRPGSSQPETKTQVLSNSSSFASLFSEDLNLNNTNTNRPKELKEEPLPLCHDMSYILFQKVKKGRCSDFGKVLCSRLRPVAAPYLKTKIANPKVVPFDFSTPSPCDINMEKRQHPPPDPYAHMNMVERFMAMTKDEAY